MNVKEIQRKTSISEVIKLFGELAYLHLIRYDTAWSRTTIGGAWFLLVPKRNKFRDVCGEKMNYQFNSHFFIGLDVCA